MSRRNPLRFGRGFLQWLYRKCVPGNTRGTLLSHYSSAMTSTSTRNPPGRSAAAMQLLAGFSVKYLP